LLLCQRWLITEEEIQKLMQYGLLPSCDEELLQPMLNLRDDVALKCLRMLKDEDRDEVMTGELALSSVLRNIRIQGDDKIIKRKSVEMKDAVVTVSEGMRAISSARRRQTCRMMGIYRIRPVLKRLTTKNKLFEVLSKPAAAPTEEEKHFLRQLPVSPRVVIMPTRPRRELHLPTFNGDRADNGATVNIAGIWCSRLIGLTYRGSMSDESVNYHSCLTTSG